MTDTLKNTLIGISKHACIGHYGIIKHDDQYIGGFLNWGIGLRNDEWIASSSRWWAKNDIKSGCTVYFYQMDHDKEKLITTEENMKLVYSANTKGTLIKSLIQMFKE